MRAHATSSDRRRSVGTSLGPPRSDWNSWLWQLVSSRAVRIKREGDNFSSTPYQRPSTQPAYPL
uniref:Uncharacterized protein n=1 Tax=Anopheles minimus TaxID=112268 RepID=A0A182WNW0_9DIPT